MAVSPLFSLLLVFIPLVVSQGNVSSIAGSTQTFEFPPPSISTVSPDPNFPNGSDVGFAGPTPSDFFFFLLENQLSRS